MFGQDGAEQAAPSPRPRRRRFARIVRPIPAIVLVLLSSLWLASYRWQTRLGFDVHSPRQWLLVHRSPWWDHQTPIVQWDLGPRMVNVSLLSLGGDVTVTHWMPGSQHRPTASRDWPGVSVNLNGWGDATGQLGAARNLRVAYWLLTLPFVLLTGVQVAHSIARRRPPGHCRRCGYDLRASPHRCPECGTPASFGPRAVS